MSAARVTPDTDPAADGGSSSLGSLIHDVTSDLSRLLNQEIALAKAEVKQEAAKAGKTAGAFGGAAGAGYFALLFGSWTVLFALASAFDSYTWAALVVFVVYAVAAAVLFVRGRAMAKQLNPKPETTIQTLKEDAEWAKNRNS